MKAPLHTHDSACCKFLGSINGNDLYTCAGSYLLRWDSEPSHYWSGHPTAQLPAEFQARCLPEDDKQRIIGILAFADMLALEMGKE